MAPVHYDIYNNRTFNKRSSRTLRQCHVFAEGRKKRCRSNSDKNCSMTAQFEEIDVTDVKNKFDFLRSIGLEIRKNGRNDNAGLTSTKTTRDLVFVDVKCELCGRTFERKADVKLHLKTHHFKMALADYICNERRAVKNCKVVIIGESCKICGKDFKCRTDVELHRKRRHFAGKRKTTRLVLKIGGEVISIVCVKRKYLRRRYENRNVNKRHENLGGSDTVDGDDNVWYLRETKRLCDDASKKDGGDAQMALVSSNLDSDRDKVKSERSEVEIEEKRLKLKEEIEENECLVKSAIGLERKCVRENLEEFCIVDGNYFVKREAEEVRAQIDERLKIERQSEEKLKVYDQFVLNVDDVVVEQISAKSGDGSRRNNDDYKLPFICQNSIIKEEVFVHEDVQRDHFSGNLEASVEHLKMIVGSKKVFKKDEEADVSEVTSDKSEIKQNSDEFTLQRISLPMFSFEKSLFASERSQVHDDEEIQEVHFNDNEMKIDRDSCRLREREIPIENNVQEIITIDDDCMEIIELQRKKNTKRNFEDVLERTDRLLCNESLSVKKSNYIFDVEANNRFIGRSNDNKNRLFRKRKQMSSIERIQEITIMSDEEMNNYSDEENCYVFNVNEKDNDNDNNNNNNNNNNNDNNNNINYLYDNEIQTKEKKGEYECKKAEVNRDDLKIPQDHIDTCSASVWIKEEVILDDYIFCTNDLNF